MLLLLPAGGVQIEADADSMTSRKEAGCLEIRIQAAVRHHQGRAVRDGGSHVQEHVSYFSFSHNRSLKPITLCRRLAGQRSPGRQVLRKRQGKRYRPQKRIMLSLVLGVESCAGCC
jgi:hypothetical protein